MARWQHCRAGLGPPLDSRSPGEIASDLNRQGVGHLSHNGTAKVDHSVCFRNFTRPRSQVKSTLMSFLYIWPTGFFKLTVWFIGHNDYSNSPSLSYLRGSDLWAGELPICLYLSFQRQASTKLTTTSTGKHSLVFHHRAPCCWTWFFLWVSRNVAKLTAVM